MPIPHRILVAAVFFAGLCGPLVAQQTSVFQCSKEGGGARLSAASMYKTSNAGFDILGPPADFAGNACASDKPFFFSVAEPDGNYQVTLVLGGLKASKMTVRGESRRLFVRELAIPANGSHTVSFNVHVRTKEIAGTTPPQVVKLKAREVGALDWDEKLTLEFAGEHPGVRSISVKPIVVPTIYLAGDSTVVDQDKEPWAAWGQMLPAFFSPMVSIANEAESGETIRSFNGERRLAKILSTIQPGDYLMIQFAHNDQKAGSGYVPAATDYKTFLRQYIDGARSHKATPILVTSMNRRNFDASGHITQTLGDYPQAMREVAAEQHVALIDLNASSKILFEAMGDAGTLHAFVHYPANTFPEQTEELKDDTHFNSYGAWELARTVVQSIRDQNLPIAAYLQPGLPAFDPAHPDPWAGFTLPPSPIVSTAKPDER